MSRFKLGLQLYSVRDFMEQDMEATLKAVSEMGYECVEFAGYFGKTAEEVKALMDAAMDETDADKAKELMAENEEVRTLVKDLGLDIK